MKYLFVWMMCVCGAFANAQSLASEVKAVTVYLNGAQLEHRATAPLKSGKQTVTLTGLSPELNAASIMVDIEPKTVNIVSVSSRTNYLNTTKDNARITTMRDSLLQAELQYERNNTEWNVLQREKNTLFQGEPIGGTSKGIAVAEIERAADFFRKRLMEIETRCNVLARENVQVEARRQRLMVQLNEQNAQVNPPTSEVTLELSINSAVNATITLKYMVRSAGWAPKYDVRATTINDPVKLIYRANVFNGSGLDWQEVNLALSTADPFAGADIPQLERWEVRKAANIAADIQEIAIIAGVQTDRRSGYNPDQKQGTEVQMRTIQVEEVHSLFTINTPYSIPKDRKPYTVEVTEYDLPAKYEYFAIPKVDSDAFLTARVTGWGKLNLVSGDASIYFNGTYLGKAFINTASQADTLALSLGRDKLTSIQREKESERSERKIFGNNEKETFYFRTNIRNNHDRPIVIKIKDQVPVSTDGDVTVESLELDGGTLQEGTGFIEWNLTIPPGEVKTIRMGYSIKTPKGISTGKSKFRTIAAPSF